MSKIEPAPDTVICDACKRPGQSLASEEVEGVFVRLCVDFRSCNRTVKAPS